VNAICTQFQSAYRLFAEGRITTDIIGVYTTRGTHYDITILRHSFMTLYLNTMQMYPTESKWAIKQFAVIQSVHYSAI